jgi:hypothetical protein
MDHHWTPHRSDQFSSRNPFGLYAAGVAALAIMLALVFGVILLVIRDHPAPPAPAALKQEAAPPTVAPTVMTQNAQAAPTQAPQTTTAANTLQSVAVQQPASKPEQPAVQQPAAQAPSLGQSAPTQPAQASAPLPAISAPSAANTSNDGSAVPASQPAPQAPSVPAPIDASALLLNASDLGDGWTPLKLEGSTARPEIQCGSQPFTLGSGIKSEARAVFQSGGTGSYLAQTLFVAGSVPEAQDAMRALWQQAACPSLRIVGIPGGPYDYQVGHTPFPSFGDETLALTLTPDDSAAHPADVVVVRQGRLLTALVYLGIDGADRDQAAAIAKAAVERMATAAQ